MMPSFEERARALVFTVPDGRAGEAAAARCFNGPKMLLVHIVHEKNGIAILIWVLLK